MSNVVTEPTRRRLEVPAARRRYDWTLIITPLVTLAVTTWGITGSGYWGDEVDTVSAVSRSVLQLFGMLRQIDAVHGLYYLLLWPVVAVAGAGEFATRFPSALSMAAAALGVTILGRRLVNRWAGLCAGLTFAILPSVSNQGQNARPYAMVTAAAVLASYFFVRAVEDRRSRWLTAYGVSLVLVGYLQMFALLLVAAHVTTLIGLGWRQQTTAADALRSARRWLVTFACVSVAMLPLLAIGWGQRGAIAWISRPGWHAIAHAATWLAAGSSVSLIVLIELGALGVAASSRVSSAWPLTRDRTAPDAGRMIGWLAAPWLLLPPVVLLTVSQIKPVFDTRYVTFCLPAVALLVGSGLAALRLPVRAAAFGLVLALAMPGQLSLRIPIPRLLVASAFLQAHEKPGDAIVYPQSLMPPWNIAYPEGFSSLRDLSMRQTPGASDRLFGTTVSQPVLEHKEMSVHRIWVVQTAPMTNPAPYIAPAFHRVHVWTLPGDVKVWLYTRPS